ADVEDARFAHVHDKDHPHGFAPDFTDRAAWEKRADFLRHQVLVVPGLWPEGHWPNGRFIWRDDNGVNKDLASGAEKDPIAARTPLQANCAMLARMGCIVFQYDMVGYCDSTKIPHREGFLDTESLLRLQSFMGLQT